VNGRLVQHPATLEEYDENDQSNHNQKAECENKIIKDGFIGSGANLQNRKAAIMSKYITHI